MAAVQQRVLNWLYSVLMTEYRDVNRTYNDVAQALSHYSSLAPRTDVYTYENGASALLLHLSGTIPVTFRGTTYRFPIALWVPHGYPQEAPLVYVTPTEGMMVRAGQHVDPQGKVYHPYLVGWAEFWDKSNILDFLAILREIFAKEPPVISRQQQNAPRPTPPPVPPLPPSIARPQSISSPPPINQSQPPPPPPKPGSSQQTYQPGGPVLRESGPPLPPLPGQDRNQYGPPIPQPPNGHPNQPQRSSSLRYDGAPPLPQPARQQSLRDSAYSSSPVSPMTPDQSYRQSQVPQDQWPLRIQQQGPQYYQQQPYPGQQPQPQPQYQQGPYQQYSQQQQQQQPPPQSKPPPPPADLLDAPLVLSIPTATSNNLPAPPIPPNPEHNLLLAKVGTSLFQQRTHTRTQTNSSLPGLQAQHKAMLTALNTMTTELQALESLQSTLNNNTQILHSALHDADKVIENSAHRAAPGIDEILVAPTVVGNQLYELVSEERSLADALFVLGRAVEKGRISPAVFAKMTRSLAREWYLKKALVRKIGRGMGLATTTSY